MKILHCCLANFYIDGYGYQENILPKMHKIQGHEVSILASTETYIDSKKIGYVGPSSYYTESGIPITRVPYKRILPHFIMRKLRIYSGVTEVLYSFKPDIIFIHDLQFISIIDIVDYVSNNPETKIYVDGHTDYINSAKNWISKNILHGIIYKWCAKKIEPYTQKFYGVLPARVEFFKSMYGISKEKVELLVMGLDDSSIDFKNREKIRSAIRNKININEDDFVLITGGKIDRRKNIHLLMQAVNELNISNIVLIIFGIPDDDIRSEFEELLNYNHMRYIGWIKAEESSDYLMASDLAVFPGTHSVLWEQSIGLGLPCVFRKWEGFQHVDLGGNCAFIENENVDEIKEVIMSIYNNPELYSEMLIVSTEQGIPNFSYCQIAKKAIEE